MNASKDVVPPTDRRLTITAGRVFFVWVAALTILGLAPLIQTALFPRATIATDRLARTTVRHLVKRFEKAHFDASDSEIINSWLAGSINPATQGDDWPFDETPIDPWDNSYILVTEANGKLSDVSGLGFYSQGLDGKSSSGGNDPDDINSWSASDTEYYDRYRRQLTQKRWARHVTDAVLITALYVFASWSIQRIVAPTHRPAKLK